MQLQPVACLADWYCTGPYSADVVERRFAVGARTRLFAARHAAGAYPTPPTEDLTIQHLIAGRTHGVFDLGAGRFEADLEPGLIGVAPARTLNQFELDAGHKIRAVCLPWSQAAPLVAEASGGRLSDLGRLHRGFHADRPLRDLLNLMWDAAGGDDPASRLLVDQLSLSVVVRLVILACQPARQARATALPAWRLRKAKALLMERLAEELSLEDLAGAVGLSPYHFARGFKAATGMPPYAWRNARRIARAQELLADPKRPIAEIAVECGFCSQAHLTNAFRRATGLTPGAWRREHTGHH